ncbi:MAG: ATP-binding protein [Bacteroidales bacterium]|nr:ATP-binding protein [Bacteroidales bacterium]
MQKIVIKNFGPISNAEIEIKKAVVLIGENGAGKSTIIKLISTFLWMEKMLVRGDYTIEYFTEKERFENEICKYHKIENYFVKHSLWGTGTSITFVGTMFCFEYKDNLLLIKKIEENSISSYNLPQIMYIPAERNLIANVKNPKTLKLISDSLVDFISEYDKAKNDLETDLELPIGDNISIKYHKEKDIVYIKGTNYEIPLNEAASGIQSNAPLYLVTWYLSKSVKKQSEIFQKMSTDEIDRFKKNVGDILSNESFTKEQRRAALSTLSLQFNKKAFINIVEEPEQNLFPISQMQMIKCLVSFCNQNADNKLIISTHSPYVLATINNLILASKVGVVFPDKICSKVDKQFWLNYDDVFAGIVREGTVEQIIDTEFEMIQMEQIDSVSREINEEFDFLYQYERDDNV